MKTKTLLLIYFLSQKLWAFQPVDINLASVEQIALLPGVGEKLAQNIQNHRLKNGRFYSDEDLLKVEGLNSKKLSKFRSQLVFGVSTKKAPPKKKHVIRQQAVIELFDLEQKVLKVTGLEQALDDDLKNRSRKSAWLPELSLVMDMGKNSFSTEKKDDARTDYLMTRGGGDMGFGIKATFNLEKLIFNTNELDVQKLMLARMNKREEVLSKLHKSYFHYLSLLNKEPEDAKAAQEIKLELLETAAKMDAMSEQAFSAFQNAENWVQNP